MFSSSPLHPIGDLKGKKQHSGVSCSFLWSMQAWQGKLGMTHARKGGTGAELLGAREFGADMDVRDVYDVGAAPDTLSSPMGAAGAQHGRCALNAAASCWHCNREASRLTHVLQQLRMACTCRIVHPVRALSRPSNSPGTCCQFSRDAKVRSTCNDDDVE